MKCNVCPNKCNIDRDSFIGECGVGSDVIIAKYYLHPFEEPCISGVNGSGCVFFAGCSLKCKFCQNYELSHEGRGKEFSISDLAEIFYKLEKLGAHNINLVTPTHYTLQIIDALKLYRPKVPIVWNTHSYESINTLNLIDEYVDIYLADLKYFKPSRSDRYANKPNYFEVASKAIKFMCQKKSPEFSGDLMTKGVIVRHLVLPQNLDESFAILDYLKGVIGDNYLSIMAQFTPFGEIDGLKELRRKITLREYNAVVNRANMLGFDKMFLQKLDSSGEKFIPSWDF